MLLSAWIAVFFSIAFASPSSIDALTSQKLHNFQWDEYTKAVEKKVFNREAYRVPPPDFSVEPISINTIKAYTLLKLKDVVQDYMDRGEIEWAVYWAKWKKPEISIGSLGVKSLKFLALSCFHGLIGVEELAEFIEGFSDLEFQEECLAMIILLNEVGKAEGLIKAIEGRKLYWKLVRLQKVFAMANMA